MTIDQQKELTKAINLIAEGRSYSAQMILRSLLKSAQNNPFAQHWNEKNPSG